MLDGDVLMVVCIFQSAVDAEEELVEFASEVVVAIKYAGSVDITVVPVPVLPSYCRRACTQSQDLLKGRA